MTIYKAMLAVTGIGPMSNIINSNNVKTHLILVAIG